MREELHKPRLVKAGEGGLRLPGPDRLNAVLEGYRAQAASERTSRPILAAADEPEQTFEV